MPPPDPAPLARPGPHEILRDASVLLDHDGRVAGINAAATARFALQGRDVLGQPFDELGFPAADPSLVRLPLADGAVLVVWPDPSVTGDVQILLAKARALESLAGPIKHELSSPLNALAMFAGIVRLEGEIPDDLVGSIDGLADAAAQVTRLTGLALELARDRPVAVRPVPPALVVDEALALTAYLLVDVKPTVRLDPGLPEAQVDPGGLRLALVLVLLEAVRALGGARATGRLRIEGRSGQDGRTVEIVVTGDAALPTGTDAAPGGDPADAGRRAVAEADFAAARALMQRDGGDLRRERDSGEARRTILVMRRSGSQPDEAAARYRG